VILLTLAVFIVILSPALLQGILPDDIIHAARMDEFPMLGSCIDIAKQLLSAIQQQTLPEVNVVTGALGPTFLDEISSLLMVAVLSIPISLCLGILLYKPLYHGVLKRALLYISHNLVSVMLAWILYRQFYFKFLIEGVLMENLTNQATLTIVNFVTQLFSAAAIGALAFKAMLAMLATRIVIGKIIMPVIGTLLRTLLFAFLIALMLLLQANPGDYILTLPMMLLTLLISGVNDWIFGC